MILDEATFSPLRLSSRVMSKFLTEWVGSIIFLSQETLNLSTKLSLYWNPKRILTFFSKWRDTLLSISHCLQILFLDLKRALISLHLTLICMLFTQQSKSRTLRANIVPCGTPHDTFKGVLNKLFVEFIEYCNFWIIDQMHIKVYIFGKDLGQRIYFWHQFWPKMLIFWENHKKG